MQSRGILEAYGNIWEASGRHLGGIHLRFSPLAKQFSRVLLDAALFGTFGLTFNALGGSLGSIWAPWGSFWPPWGSIWPPWGSIWPPWGSIWAPFGHTLEATSAILETCLQKCQKTLFGTPFRDPSGDGCICNPSTPAQSKHTLGHYF